MQVNAISDGLHVLGRRQERGSEALLSQTSPHLQFQTLSAPLRAGQVAATSGAS
jgi:hypothetical protein